MREPHSQIIDDAAAIPSKTCTEFIVDSPYFCIASGSEENGRPFRARSGAMPLTSYPFR